MALFGSDEALSIVIKARDEASKVFSDVEKKVKGMSGGMEAATSASKGLAVGIAGAGAAAVTFGGFAVKAAMDAEAEMAKFRTTMATIPGVTKEATNAILARAAAAVRLGFDDEEAANVMANLYQRTGDVNEAMRLAGGAMDLARAKNVSLTDAARMIQLVMSGNARALKEYGIEIDDTLPPMQALDQLFGKLSGQASAFSETFKGQLAVLNIEWTNFLETVGTHILPLLTELLKRLTPIIEKMIEFAGNVANVTNWLREHQTVLLIVVGAIVGALIPALAALAVTIWTTVIPAVLAAGLALAPFILGGAIVGGIVAGVLWIIKNWDMLVEKTGNIWSRIKGYFAEGVNFLIGLAEGWANGWVNAVNTIIKALNKIHFSIPDWVPGVGGKSFGISLPLAPEVKLPRMEHGGTVPGAVGTAVPIMAHGQERIIPASQRAQSGGGNTYSVVINNPQVRSQSDVAYLRQQIEDALRDVSRGHKLATI